MTTIQERYFGDKWAQIVIPICLNKCSGEVALPVIDRFLLIAPTPAMAATMGASDVALLLQPLGLQSQRARHIIECAQRVIAPGVESFPVSREAIMNWPGIGPYGADSYAMFALGLKEPPLSEDEVLWEWWNENVKNAVPHDDLDEDNLGLDQGRAAKE